MTAYSPMTNLPEAPGYKKGDLLVLFGELFGRGYANGIVDEARRAGMTVVGATVGRRDNGGELRPLTTGELAEAEALLGGKIINIPLEAGFDLEPADDGVSPVERLKGIKPDEWESARFGEGLLEQSRCNGVARFEANLERFVAELKPFIPAGGSVLFVHTMAGGIPRVRLFMPLLNRIFKGTGDKFLPSERFWNSELGRFSQLNFNEVTADTFGRLLEGTVALRGERSRPAAAPSGMRPTATMAARCCWGESMSGRATPPMSRERPRCGWRGSPRLPGSKVSRPPSITARRSRPTPVPCSWE